MNIKGKVFVGIEGDFYLRVEISNRTECAEDHK